MRKFLTIIVVIAILVVSGYFLSQKNKIAKVVQQTSTTTPTATYEWVFKEGETGSSGVPNTTISLKVDGKSYPLDDYDGNCKEVKSNETGILGEKPDTGEISRAQCWFGGGGYELGVFKSGTKTIVKVGELGEGDKDGKPFRGNFKTVLTL